MLFLYVHVIIIFFKVKKTYNNKNTEERKHTENDPKCNALGQYCVPLVMESYGAWGQEAMDLFKMLASRLAIISGKP